MGLEPSILFDREGSGFLGITCGDFFPNHRSRRGILDKELYLLDRIKENVCRPFTHVLLFYPMTDPWDKWYIYLHWSNKKSAIHMTVNIQSSHGCFENEQFKGKGKIPENLQIPDVFVNGRRRFSFKDLLKKLRPRKLTVWTPKWRWMEDECPLQRADFQVNQSIPGVCFRGSI